MFDVFPFSGELDLLECRLTELYEHVHAFVIVESNLTYSGREKPLHFAESAPRFDSFAGKIRYVIAHADPGPSPAIREAAQRNAAWDGMDDFGDGDILIQGDADEIPHPDDLASLAAVTGRWVRAKKIMHRHHPVAVNLLDSTPWGGYVPHLGPGRPDMMELRQRLHSRVIPEVTGRGWHFSWLGGPEAMKAKVRTFSHPDLVAVVDEHADRMYRDKVSPATRERLVETVIDETWPKFMQERKGPPSWYWPGEQDGC